MKKMLFILAGIVLLAIPAPASADTDRDYLDAMVPLVDQKRQLQKDISQINITLAVSLGKTDGYDENEVRVHYGEFAAAQQRLLAVELEMMLVLKKYYPA